MGKVLTVVLIAILLLFSFHAVARADSPIATYPVQGAPQAVAVESRGRVWFTVPGDDLIGLLVVTSTVDYRIVTYTSTISEPFGLAYALGEVWFTGLSGNALGRLNPANGAIVEYPIPTDSSSPVALEVLPGTPSRVWFAEKTGNAIGQMVVTSTTDYAFYEYPIPIAKFGTSPQVQDLAVASWDSIWFTAPGSGAIGNFRPSYYIWNPDASFTRISDNSGIVPWSIIVDDQGYPWFTDIGGDQLVKYFPQTIALFDFYSVLSEGAGVYDLVVAQSQIMFSERDVGRLGSMTPVRRAVQEYGVQGAQPLGIAADTDGHVWVADAGGNRIIEWRPPYFHRAFIPVVLRQ